MARQLPRRNTGSSQSGTNVTLVATPNPTTTPKAAARRKRRRCKTPGPSARTVTTQSISVAKIKSASGFTWYPYLKTTMERNGPVCRISAGSKFPKTA